MAFLLLVNNRQGLKEGFVGLKVSIEKIPVKLAAFLLIIVLVFGQLYSLTFDKYLIVINQNSYLGFWSFVKLMLVLLEISSHLVLVIEKLASLSVFHAIKKTQEKMSFCLLQKW